MTQMVYSCVRAWNVTLCRWCVWYLSWSVACRRSVSSGLETAGHSGPGVDSGKAQRERGDLISHRLYFRSFAPARKSMTTASELHPSRRKASQHRELCREAPGGLAYIPPCPLRRLERNSVWCLIRCVSEEDQI